MPRPAPCDEVVPLFSRCTTWAWPMTSPQGLPVVTSSQRRRCRRWASAELFCTVAPATCRLRSPCRQHQQGPERRGQDVHQPLQRSVGRDQAGHPQPPAIAVSRRHDSLLVLDAARSASTGGTRTCPVQSLYTRGFLRAWQLSLTAFGAVDPATLGFHSAGLDALPHKKKLSKCCA